MRAAEEGSSPPAGSGSGATRAEGYRDPEHLPALDGLRGVAILLVLAFHFTWFGPASRALLSSAWSRLPTQLALAGWLGVDLFFVLSGFLITRILLANKERPRFFTRFYLRRVIRIVPPYYLFLVLGLVLTPLLPPIWASTEHYRPWLWSYLTNVRIALRGWDAVPLPYQHFWSLAVEEQFYLVWPVLVFVLREKGLERTCLFLMAAAIVFRAVCVLRFDSLLPAYVSTFAKVDELAAGGWLACRLQSTGGVLFSRSGLLRIGGCSLLALAGLFYWRGGLMPTDPLVVVVGTSLAMLLFSSALGLCLIASGAEAWKRVLSRPSLRMAGRYSYTVYIVHQPIAVTLAVSGAWTALATHVGPGSTWVLVVAQYGVPLVCSFGLAAFSWRFFEARVLALKKLVG